MFFAGQPGNRDAAAAGLRYQDFALNQRYAALDYFDDARRVDRSGFGALGEFVGLGDLPQAHAVLFGADPVLQTCDVRRATECCSQARLTLKLLKARCIAAARSESCWAAAAHSWELALFC